MPVLRIRAIDLSTKAVTTLAGGSSGFSDATGGSAKFHYPQAITITPDGTTLVIGDRFNAKIRALDLSNNAVTTVGGPGMPPHLDLSPPLTQTLIPTSHLPPPTSHLSPLTTSHPPPPTSHLSPLTYLSPTLIHHLPPPTSHYLSLLAGIGQGWPDSCGGSHGSCTGYDFHLYYSQLAFTPDQSTCVRWSRSLTLTARLASRRSCSPRGHRIHTLPLRSLLISGGSDMYVVRKVT